MGLWGSINRHWGRRRREAARTCTAPRRAALEPMEARQLLAADIHLGAVYFEEASGDDSAGDRFEVTFAGGEAGTQLRRLILDGDKDGLGLSAGDVFFDTQTGGLGAFKAAALRIESSNGFTVTNTTVVDGGTRLVFEFDGFDAGEKLVFTIDVDEAQFVNAGSGEIDVNSLAEGGEFQRSKLIGEFAAPHFFDATATATFFDAYDDRFRALEQANGTQLALPPDNYMPPHDVDRTDRTAGAAATVGQQPLPITISGTVFHDPNLNNTRQAGEPGLAGVRLTLFELRDGAYTSTGRTVQTDAAGHYQFDAVAPGVYRLVEQQPSGFFSVGARAGNVNGAVRGTVESADAIRGITLLGGEDSVDNDFAEARQAELHGAVFYDANNNGRFDAGEVGIGGARVVVQYIAPNGTPGETVELVTAADGSWSATGLRPGDYRVSEITPLGYLDGLDAPGDAGGTAQNPGDLITGVFLAGGQIGRNYNFGELLPASIRGRVHADRDGDCIFDPGETPLAGVEVRLLDATGSVIDVTTTNAQGVYEFTGLAPGVYGVFEVQPNGYFDGDEHVGTAGGAITANDRITGITLGPGVHAVDYNFCEHEPVSIAGFVYVDVNNNGRRDAGEAPIAGVTLALLDAGGNATGRTTTTGADGSYRFEGLAPGVYGVRETQPVGFIDGLDSAGSAGGAAVNPGDQITGARLDPGVHGVNYNFGELLPSSIRGRVHADGDGDCIFEEGETPLAGVEVRLLDATGSVIDVTTTNAQGVYEFSGLAPGVYGVFEVQPAGYFDGDEHVGTAGGAITANDRITGVTLGPGVHAVDYNFCEHEPVSIAGFVYVDANNNGRRDAGEAPIAGVTLALLDAGGNATGRTTTTGADGSYRFEGLAPGVYGVRETQPVGFIDGLDSAGSAGGVAVNPGDQITGARLDPGVHGVNYNFGELMPSSIRGRVHADRDGDCIFDPGETPLAGVEVRLLDAAGSVIDVTTTNAEGVYEFTGLAPGVYGVFEVQPAGYFDGDEHVGTAGGAITANDRITGVTLGPGVHAVDYNFCELEPASIQGRVHAEADGDCILDEGETPLAGVVIELLDADGNLIRTTTTNAQGVYEFSGLAPGVYGVREVQPAGFFDGDEHVGSEGGRLGGDDLIVDVALGSGAVAVDYNFCEILPSSISGHVFQDGPTIVLNHGEPLNLDQRRDGSRTPDDRPLAGVTLWLGDALGVPILGPDGQPRTAVTDAAGYYEFTGLPAGVYSIFEQQPPGMIDGFDTPGAAGGVAINDTGVPIAVALTVPHNFDAIVGLRLLAGQQATDYDFSEVVVVMLPPPPPPVVPEAEPQGVPVPLRLDPFTPPPFFAPTAPLSSPLLQPPGVLVGFSTPRESMERVPVRVVNYSWHLSVVDAGYPRGEQAKSATPSANLVNSRFDVHAWQSRGGELTEGRWTLRSLARGEDRQFDFGVRDGVAMTGDFNGDGLAEIAVFHNGEWFIDLNGNGVWDRGDLWAKLGSGNDLPAVGDWDGDGKTDIGVFGPAWPGDPRAVAAEPGLPDLDNRTRGARKNMPPRVQEAAIARRMLKRTADGTLRADLVDHVFLYGTAGDYPVSGDFNGDGVDTIGVFRDGRWTLDVDGSGDWTEGDRSFELGARGDLPVVGDFNGDGMDQVGVYRNGVWLLDMNDDQHFDGRDETHYLGAAGDTPVTGDFDGDGRDEIGVHHVAGGRPTHR